MQYRQHRYPAYFPVQVRTAAGTQQAQVNNVNQNGGCLHGMRHLCRGDKLQLNVLSQWVDAIVLWVDGNRSGIAFRPGLTTHQLDTLLHRPGAPAKGRGTRVGFNLTELR